MSADDELYGSETIEVDENERHDEKLEDCDSGEQEDGGDSLSLGITLRLFSQLFLLSFPIFLCFVYFLLGFVSASFVETCSISDFLNFLAACDDILWLLVDNKFVVFSKEILLSTLLFKSSKDISKVLI